MSDVLRLRTGGQHRPHQQVDRDVGFTGFHFGDARLTRAEPFGQLELRKTEFGPPAADRGRRHRLKRDWNAGDRPGTLPRLLAVVNQPDLTCDLLGLSGEELVAQLPEEFGEWRPTAKS